MAGIFVPVSLSCWAGKGERGSKLVEDLAKLTGCTVSAPVGKVSAKGWNFLPKEWKTARPVYPR